MKTFKSLAIALFFGALMCSTNIGTARAQDNSTQQTQTQSTDQSTDQGAVNSTNQSTDQSTTDQNNANTSADQNNSQLPQTASNLPLVGLMGMLSLAGAGALGMLAKHNA